MKIAILALAAFASGCYTVFTGASKVPEGRKTCEQYCQLAGMELTGMVFMGEYTDGCICEVRRDRVSVSRGDASAGAAAAAVGVVLQMRRAAEQRQTYMPPPPMR